MLLLLSLQDSVQSQSENLQVYLRVRPFTAAESDNGESQVTLSGHRLFQKKLWKRNRFIFRLI